VPFSLRRDALLYAALALLFVVVLIYRVRDTIDRLDEVVHADRIARPPFGIDFPELAIGSLEPEALAVGLKEGDVILGANGRQILGLNDFGDVFANTPADTPLRLDAETPSASGASRRPVTLTLQPLRTGPALVEDWLSFAIGTLALPYLCFALGFWVAAARIRDKLAWVMLMLLLSMAEFVGTNWRTLFGRHDSFQIVSVVYQPLAANLWPMSMMLFGLYFPERLPLDRRIPWAKWIVIVPILFRVAGTNVAFDVVALNDLRTATTLANTFRPFLPVVGALHFVAIGVSSPPSVGERSPRRSRTPDGG
jgi:phosphoserine phosphatase RsbU/P